MRKTTYKKKLLAQARALAPESMVSMLSYIAFFLFILYIVFVVLTVYYATLETTLTANIRDNESSLTQLETTYYDGVAKVSSSDPVGQGFVRPTDVRYEAQKTSSGLTFAGN